MYDTYTLNTVILSYQGVKTGIIYFELLIYLNQHQSQTFFFIEIIVFTVLRARKPLRWFTFPAKILDCIEVFTRKVTLYCSTIKYKGNNSFHSL